MKLFMLYQTDLHKSKSSKVCFGVYSTKEKAIDAAKEYDLYSHQSEILIEECRLDTFGEI